jgi:hypothetical protein
VKARGEGRGTERVRKNEKQGNRNIESEIQKDKEIRKQIK